MATAPPTRADDVVDTIHGVPVHDPYRWLEDEAAPEVREWLAVQQRHARSVLDADPSRAAVAARLAEVMDVGLLGPMVPRGRFRFFTRRGPGMDQAALYVLDDDGSGRTLVDPGPMSPDGTTSLDWWYPSRDGEMVCFGLSEAGGEDSTLMLLESGTGRVLPDRIPHCKVAAGAFEPGNRALLYSRFPAPGEVPPGEEHYHRHVWRHVVGTDIADDVRVFGEGRDKLDYPIGLSFSPDARWTVLTIAQGYDRTAVFLRERDAGFRSIFEGYEKELHPWFAGSRLLAMTNLDAPNYRLVEIDPARPEPGAWREVVPESPDHVLLGAAVTSERLLVHHLADASSRVAEHAPDGTVVRELPVPGLSTVTGIGADPYQGRAYLTFESFTAPAVTLQLTDMSQVMGLRAPAGFDPARHPVRQVRYRSKDGTEVPMFLVGRGSGAGPTVLTGYGGFNLARTPAWAGTIVPFLESGGLFAVANLRGGGEYGERWHRAGMLGNKQNVFDDFIAAAQWLIGESLTTPGQLGILGGSNGGLLVGAAMTQRPELFGAVVCRVPLLDMIRYERFKVAKLWASEYGSADDAEDFSWLLAYSPYHRVRDGVRYPPILIITGEEDSRVDPMHARKMAARLQGANPDGEVLLRVEPRAGHGQGKPVGKLVPEEADVWSFLMRHLEGMEGKQVPPVGPPF